MYPEGVAVTSGNYDGGMFDPPSNFAKLAEAANGYGEVVSDPEQVGSALRRALDLRAKARRLWSLSISQPWWRSELG